MPQDLGEILAANYDSFVKYALKISSNSAEVHDIVHDAFTRVRGKEAIEGGYPRTYICTVIRNIHIDMLRKQRKRRTVCADLTRFPTKKQELPDDTMDFLEKALIGYKFRKDVRMFKDYFAYELTYSELARRYNCSCSTVAWRIGRIRDYLGRILTVKG